MRKQIFIGICLLVVFFSMLSVVSASDLVDNNTISTANDELNTISVANDQEDKLSESIGTFADLNGLIDGSPEGGNITLEGNYTYSSEDTGLTDGIVIDKSITIDGKGYILNALNAVSIFNIQGNSKVILKNINFINAKGTNGGAIKLDPSTYLEIINCNFTNNSALQSGGAIFVANSTSFTSNLTISNSIFNNNSAISGGALYLNDNLQGVSLIENSKFIKCTSSGDGGAAYIHANDVEFRNVIFEDNVAGDDGAAIFWQGDNGILYNVTCINNRGISATKADGVNTSSTRGGALSLTGDNIIVNKSSFTQNSAYMDESKDATKVEGGAIFATGNGITIMNTVFDRCNATNNGGAVYVLGNNTNIINCAFNNNTGSDGGAVYVNGTGCTLYNSTFTDNTADDDGGAIFWAGSNGIIYNITCTNNKGISANKTDNDTSSTRGGTICLTGNNMVVSKSRFTLGSAFMDEGKDATKVDGGAIFATGDNVTISDTAFDRCSATTNGGAVYVLGDSTNIIRCTFEKSTAKDGAALYVNGTNCTLYDSTFTDNIAGDDGGAIDWEGDNGYMYNITCTNNKGISSKTSSSRGGAICLTGDNVTVTKSTFTSSNVYIDREDSSKVDGGALFITGNDVTISENEFYDCSAVNYGGAIYVMGNKTQILNCTFNDTKSLVGGAIFIAGNDATVDDSMFRYNDASGPAGGSGGAVYIEGAGGIISNSDFAYATAVNYGGAIAIWGANGLITNNTFDSSSTSKFNGGTIFVNGINATISLSNFTRSRAMGDQFSRGGAIDVRGDNANILSCNFDDCESHLGGVIYVSGMNAIIDSADVKNSKAYEGGAIYIEGDNTYISLSNFTDLNADNYGGAIYIAGDNTNISQTNFENCNVRLYHGGAIYIAGEKTYIEYSNFTSCNAISSVARGGAIDIQGEYTTVVNSNFNECNAVEGGCIFAYGNFAKIDECIFNLSNAKDGGALYLISWGALIKGSNVSKCNASLNGGAIYVAAGGPQIVESNFEECLAKGTAYGNGGGAIYVLGPDTHITDSTFNNNRVVSDRARGGTIYITGERTFIEGSDFNDSYAGQGGIIFIEGEEAIINTSSFANSLSKYSGGAISVSGHNATIEWSTFDNISASSNGGAIYVDGEDTSILHSSFFNCTNGKYYGGAVYINDIGTTIAFSNFTLSNADIGGSIYISGENTTITYCNLDNNTANTAGAIKVTGANTIISNSNMTNNFALTGSGGAIDLSGRNASVLYSYFYKNDALLYGGAINWEGGHGDDSIIGSTFVNNTCHGAGLGGGAVYWTASKNKEIGAGGLIEDSIFINNTAYGHHGGAIDWFHAINSTINNCLFINNRASSDGGALYTGDKNGNSVNFTISNSQFYNNTAGKHGGAIANQMMNSWIFNNTFDGNKAYSSGGTILMKEAGAKNSVIDHCYIYNSFCHQADKWGQGGGAIHIGSGDTNVTISNSAIINSTANRTYGGAIAMESASSSMYNVTIQNVETCDGPGGAIYWSGSNGNWNNVTIFNSSSHAITNERVANGGAIYLSGANCNLNDVHIASSSSNINDSSIGKNNYGGAVFVGGNNNIITNITIDDSSASSVKMNTRGGAIFWSGTSGTLINASISNTLANGQGGAIYWNGGSATVSNVFIEYAQTDVVNSTNSADGGAIFFDSNSPLNNVYIIDSLASTTNGDIRGGAIYANKLSAMNNVTVIGSRATTENGNSYAGALYLVSYSNAPLLNIDNSSFESNTANYGGAIYSNRNIHVVNTSFTGNVALDGGAVYSKNGKSEYVNATFADNSAKRGGAVFVDNMLLLIYDSVLKNNTAEEKGGAIYYNYINTERDNRIENTRIVNNTAFSGSAIYANRFNKLTLKDVVLLDNQANADKFIEKAIGVDETGQNYTSGVFLGFDNLLNAMWCDSDVYNLICNNVTYWDANGTTVINSKPGKSNREAGQNITIELFNGNGEKINETNVTTDHNGKFKFIFDAKDGETYFFAYTHKTDRYYTYIRETHSNSSLVKVYVYNPLHYNQTQTILISLTDGAWGDISGNVTVRINDTNNSTFVVEVINGTATIENISGFLLGDYNVSAVFKGDLNHTGDTDWTVFTVVPYDDLHITKDINVTGDYVNVTDIIKYTINVTNHGPSKALGVNVTEILSPYLKLIGNETNDHGYYNYTGGYWYIGDLEVDELATLTIVVQVITAGPITNTVWVTGEGNDTNITNNIDSARNITALPIVDLSITKEVNVTHVDIGVTDVIKFTVVVKNNGPCNATGVYVDEKLSPCLELMNNVTTKGIYNASTWLINELAVGENATLTIVARVVYAGIIENEVIVKSHENDTNLSNNKDNITALSATAQVDLAINKTVNVTGKVNVTDLIEFTISVTNNGPCNAVGVYVSEVLDYHLKLISNTTTIGKYEGGTWLIGNVEIGAVHNLTIVAQVISVGEISNVVSVTGYDNDTNLSNNKASIDNITALPIVDLMINKTVNVKSEFVNVSDWIEFTITVHNNGPCDATGVKVTEILDSHLEFLSARSWSGKYNRTSGIWDIGDLGNNVTTVLVIEARVASAGVISNVVVVNSTENDTNKSNNKDEIPNITALPIVDLAITKRVNVTTSVVNVTDKIRFTIIVMNNGPCDAHDVYVTEKLSPYLKLLSNYTDDGTYDGSIWHIGYMANHSSAFLTIEAEVIGNGSIENKVVVDCYENDTNPYNDHAEVYLTALPVVDLAINKTVNVTGKVNVTDLIEFTISVTNNGPSNATNVYVGEILSSYLTLVSNKTTVGEYDGATWYIGNLNVGEVHNLTIVARVNSVGVISNAVFVTGLETDKNMSNNRDAIDNITALPIVDLVINKTVNVQSLFVNVTDKIEFTVTVHNNGPCDATGVKVTEILDSHLEFISARSWSGKYNRTSGIWDIGDLGNNVTTVLVIEARVASAGVISNVVVVNSTENDTNESNNKNNITNITALPIVDLAITKRVNVTTSVVNVSDKIRFTIIVMNNGPCDAHDVYVTEKLSPYLKLLSNYTDDGTYDGSIWHIGYLANHSSTFLTIEAEVIGNGSIENKVVVDCYENDTNPYNDHAEVYLTALPVVDLGIIKRVNVTDKVNVTDVIEFNITVYNNGPSNATNVYVGEILSPYLELISNKTTVGEYDGATWYIGNLNVGEVHNLTIVARVKSVGVISNAVFVTGLETDKNMSNNRDAIDNITALPIVDLEITKTVDVQSLYVNVTDKIVFTVTVHNNGPCDATGVKVTEVLNSHLEFISARSWSGEYNETTGIWDIGDLGNNVTTVLVIETRVASAGVISNVVVVNSTENDTNESNNKNNITNITALPIVDLMIEKTVNVTVTTVNVTNVLKFTVTVHNNGPCNASDVYVDEELSQYLKLLTNTTTVGEYDGRVWHIGNLANGSSAVLTIEAEVIGEGAIENKVVVHCYENDTNPYNDHDEVYLNAIRIVDLVIDKTVNVSSTDVEVMDVINFTITVRNDGPCNATGVYVVEPLSPYLELIRVENSTGVYDGYKWDIGDMDNGTTATLVIVARVAYAGTIENEVEVFSSQLDTNITNNKDNITPLRAYAHVDWAITKTVNVTGRVNVSDLIEFNITVTNNGPCNASGVYVSEVLDSHLELISNTTTRGSYADGTWIIGLLEVGEVHNLTIVAKVIKSGNISNFVSVDGYGNDSNSSNNNASIDNITAFDVVDLVINKTVNVESLYVNVTDEIEFTVTVHNNGPCDATGVKVTEVLNSHLEFISARSWSGEYNKTTGIWDIGDLGNNVTTVLVIRARVASAGVISNVVVVNSTENDTNESNNKNNITNITALPIVDLAINKTVNVTVTTVNVTNVLKFTVTVHNNGPCNASDVYVDEELSPYLKLLTNTTTVGEYDGRVWHIGNLTNGSSAVLTIEAEVIGNGSIENKVVVHCYENDTNPYNDHSEVYLNAIRIVDLMIDKKVSVNSTDVEVMDVINFTITVHNDGPCNATGVYVVEPLSPYLELIRVENSTGVYDGYKWDIGDMDNGTTATLVIVARVAYAGTIENEVEVFSNQVDTNVTNNKDNITPLNASAHIDLAITKTVNVTGNVNVSDLIEFNITVTNKGPCNASGVYVSEVLDSHLELISNTTTRGSYADGTWIIGLLEVGEVHNLTIVAKVIRSGNISNFVSVDGYGNDSNSSNNNASIDNITALDVVDLVINKTVNVQSLFVNVTDEIEFTITVHNNGPSDATGVKVTEILNSHLEFISARSWSGEYNNTTGIWDIGDLANNVTTVLVINARVASAGVISNVVVVNSTENDTNESNNKNNITNITALPLVDLMINKTVNVTITTVNVTNVIKFTVNVTNNGPCNASDVYVDEELSPYLKLLTNTTTVGEYDGRVWHIGNLTNGSSAVLTIEAEVIRDGAIENKVVVHCYENDTNPYNDHSEVYLNAIRIVDLMIDKKVNVTSTDVEVQHLINFTITVHNDGPCNATGVYVIEQLSPCLDLVRVENSTGVYDGYKWDIGDMDNGTTATLVIVARIMYEGTIENEVEVFSNQVDTNVTNNKDNITPLTARAHIDLAITKTVNATGKVNVTDFVEFNITVTNYGPCNATGVYVGEVLDSTILKLISYNATKGKYEDSTWNIGELNVGDVHKLIIVAQVISVGNVTNVVSITGYGNDSNSSNNNASIDNITSLPVVDLQITKEVNVTGKVNVTDVIKFTITVRNNGPWYATDIDVTEVLSPSLKLLSNTTTAGRYDGSVWHMDYLGINASAVLTIIAQVNKSGNITNVVSVKSNENDTNDSNNNDSIDNITALPIVDLKVTKTADSIYANVTRNVTYTITVVNNGPCNATDVNVAEFLSPLVQFLKADPEVGYYNETNHIWHIGDLNVGVSVNLTIICKVMANGTIENVVVVDCHENDTDLDNNHDEFNVTADFIIDLSVVKEVNVTGFVNVTDLVKFTITAYNNGPCNATNVYVGEILSPHLRLISSNATKGRYDGLTWRIGNMTVGEVHNMTIVAEVISEGVISNEVVIEGKEFDINASNNNDTIDNFTALPVVDLEITKSVNVYEDHINFGEDIVFIINVRNRGPCDATNVTVSEILSPHLELVSYDATSGDYNVTTGIWYIGDLKDHYSDELVLYCKVSSVGVISNVVIVNSTENDTDPNNNEFAIPNITALPIVDLQITKEVNVSPAVVNVTDIIKYTITVTNNGPCNATNVTVTEELTQYLKLLSNKTDNGTYDGYIWHIGNLTNGSTVVLTIEAEVMHEGLFENVVEVKCYENDTDYDNNVASVEVTALAIVDLIINKTVNVTSKEIAVGSIIEFNVTVYNNGPCNATGVYVSEGLSPCLELIGVVASVGSYDGYTWTIDNLNNGTAATLTIVARVVYSGIIENEVKVYSYENDTNLTNNDDNITPINASTFVDLAANKTVNVTGIVYVGDLVEFNISVVNNGPCNATGVIVGEILDPHLKIISNTTTIGKYDGATWIVGNLTKGEVHNLTIVAEVILPGIIANAVNVTGIENDTNTSNDNASIENITSLLVVDLSINKTVNVTGCVNVTDFIEFNITVVNNGPCNATGVYVSEVLNSNLKLISNTTTMGRYDGTTWVIGNLTKKSSAVLIIVAQVISTGNITNAVNVTGVEPDTNESNNNDTIDNITALPIVDVKVNKTVDVTKAFVGDNITYTITVKNNGPSVATNVNVTEKLSEFVVLVHYNATQGNYDSNKNIWYVGTLSNTSVATLKLTVKIIADGTIKNSVIVKSDENDTNLTNNNYTSDDVISEKLPTPIDLHVYNITYGEDEILTVTLPVNATGTVNITVANRTYADVEIINGNVELPVTDLAGGNYTVDVVYGGDWRYLPNSTQGVFNVARAVPIITIEVADIWVWETEVLNVTVNAPGSVFVTVNGITVEIPLDNGVVTTDVLAASTKPDYKGNATWNIIGLPVGTYPAFALYPGNENYTSVNTSDVFRVMDIPTTVIITADDIHVGEDAVIKIVVGPEGVRGNVTVNVDGKNYTLPLDDGSATLVVPGLKAGEKDVTVWYGGYKQYCPSQNSTEFNVLKIKPPVDIYSPEIDVGEDGIITVTVPDDATGTITIEIDGKRYTQTIEYGEAVFIIPGLKVGVHDIKAYYSGDDKYLPANATGEIKVKPVNNNTNGTIRHHGGIPLSDYPTGNPIFVLLLVLLAIGSLCSRRIKK